MKIDYPVRQVDERQCELFAFFNDLIRKLTFVQTVSLSDEPILRPLTTVKNCRATPKNRIESKAVLYRQLTM